ncbi:MAG: hypothetical protein ACP5LX_00040 [Nitrososphaeria archaeon]|jgi:small subunit ribosomal protein S3Ae
MPKVAKVKDRWKTKVWIEVLAPDIFGNVSIAKIPSNDEQSAVGRIVPISYYQVNSENPENNNIKLYLQITKVESLKAKTIVKRVEYAREVYRSMIKRGSSLVEWVGDYKTSDGMDVRVHISLFTPEKINWSRMHKIRLAINKVLTENIPNLTYDQLLEQLLRDRTLIDKVTEEAKKIYPVKNAVLLSLKLITKLVKPLEAPVQ